MIGDQDQQVKRYHYWSKNAITDDETLWEICHDAGYNGRFHPSPVQQTDRYQG
ncbi:MAG: hypothetical protein M5U34_46825 [Chloroflexi bacterium]|nr:hypothetical protein [Chloroflexota bacterium]